MCKTRKTNNIFNTFCLKHAISLPKKETKSKITDFIEAQALSISRAIGDIQCIILNNNITPMQKQIELESLTHFFNKAKKRMLMTLPIKLKTFVDSIDSMVKGTTPSEHTHSYLIATFGKIEDKKKRVYPPRPSKLDFIQKLIVFYRVHKCVDNSFGLSLMYQLCKIIRTKTIDTSSLTKAMYKLNDVTKKRDIIVDNDNVYIFKTQFLENLAKSLLKSYILLSEMAFKLLAKRLTDNNFLSKEDRELYDLLKEKSNRWQPSDTDVTYFMGMLAVYFELSGVFYSDTILANSTASIKQRNVFKIPKDVYFGILALGYENSNLPSVVPPKNWIYNNMLEKGTNVYYGGYHANADKLYPAYIMRNELCIANTSEAEVDNINYLQSMPFVINKNFLEEFLLSNMIEVICVYLYKTLDIPGAYSIFEKKRHATDTYQLHLLDLETFILSDSILRSRKLLLANSLDVGGEKIKLQRSVDFRIIELKMKYQTLIQRFFDLVYTLEVASIYKNIDFYFPVIMDFRGRVYYEGYPFGPQADNLGHSLIELKKTVGYVSKTVEVGRLYEYYISTLKRNVDNYFMFKKGIVPYEYNQIGLDVSCSGLQVMSGLLGYDQGLKDTNFLVEKSNVNLDVKQDLYTQFLTIFLDNYPLNFLAKDLKLDKMIHEEGSIEREDEEVNITNVKYPSLKLETEQQVLIIALLQAFRTFFERSTIKYWIMCLLYSEGHRSRAIELMEYYDGNRKLFPKEIGKDYRLLVYKVAFKLSMVFESLFYKSYPALKKLVDLVLKTVVSKDKLVKDQGVWLCSNKDSLKVFYVEQRCITKKFDYLGAHHKRVQYVCRVYTNTVDVSRFSRSVMPNFIHYLDSRVLNVTVRLCRNNDVPVYVNHDCFYTYACFGEKVKSFYFLAFKEVILETDVLTFFFETNGVEKSLYNDFVIETNRCKNNILDKINNGFYSYSSFILS